MERDRRARRDGFRRRESHTMSPSVNRNPQEKIGEAVVRNFRAGDEEALIRLLSECFGSIEHLPRVRSDLSRADPDRQGFLAVEKAGSTVGCIAVVSLPRKNWYDLRYLAVRDAFSNSEMADVLIQKAVANVEARGYEYLKATTPAVQPYVDSYEKFQFTPVRRILRLAWDLAGGFERREHPVEVRELSKDDAERVGGHDRGRASALLGLVVRRTGWGGG